jgi:hypothetical protein
MTTPVITILAMMMAMATPVMTIPAMVVAMVVAMATPVMTIPVMVVAMVTPIVTIPATVVMMAVAMATPVMTIPVMVVAMTTDVMMTPAIMVMIAVYMKATVAIIAVTTIAAMDVKMKKAAPTGIKSNPRTTILDDEEREERGPRLYPRPPISERLKKHASDTPQVAYCIKKSLMNKVRRENARLFASEKRQVGRNKLTHTGGFARRFRLFCVLKT